MSKSAWVCDRLVHGGKEGVARAEADDHLAGGGGTHAYQAAWIVTRPESDFGLGIELVFLNEVGRNVAGDC